MTPASLLLPLLREYWFVPVLAALLGAIWIQSSRLESARDALIAEQRDHEATRGEYRNAVNTAALAAAQQRREYQNAAERAAHEHRAVLEQVKAHAVRNFVARYGDPRNLGNGLRIPPAVPAADSAGAGAPEGDQADDGTAGEFVAACARDAGRLEIWQDWCRANHCEVIQ